MNATTLLNQSAQNKPPTTKGRIVINVPKPSEPNRCCASFFNAAAPLVPQFKLSTIIAIPCPPPMQAVASPYFFFRRRNS